MATEQRGPPLRAWLLTGVLIAAVLAGFLLLTLSDMDPWALLASSSAVLPASYVIA